jgi:DNA processing protein
LSKSTSLRTKPALFHQTDMASVLTSQAYALTQEDVLHWLALRMVPGLGTVSTIRLLTRLKSPQAIFRASTTELEAAGLSAAQARNVSSGCSFDDAVDQQQKLMSFGAQIITYHDSRYPQQLREIFDPPLLLFAAGNTQILATHSIAVVGTRNPTPYGMAAAERLSADLSRAGLTITSGMAQRHRHRRPPGCSERERPDHRRARLRSRCSFIRPATAASTTDHCSKRVSWSPNSPCPRPPFPQNFPIRNRIVSGLSIGVLIVEGAQHSGSAITAKLAMDQGREVFAVPGNITSKMSWGPNLLNKGWRSQTGPGMERRH